MSVSVHHYDGFLPGCHTIEAYGNGGFRFAGMSHKGSVLALPSGIYIWNISSDHQFDISDFVTVLKEAEDIDFFYIGTGDTIRFLNKDVVQILRKEIRVVETMTTGMAAQTYNILTAENRRVAAALIAVD